MSISAVPGRPLLLMFDGHSTHYQPAVVRFAKEPGVIMLCLPPHTTHESQPLDCGVFGPLKTKWSENCHQFFQKNPGKVITKFNFNKLFSEAWLKYLIPANIIAGFRKCGVYSYNPTAISIQEAGVTVSREVLTVGEIGELSPCNEDEGVSNEAAPTCGPDGGVTPGSDPDGETSSCGVVGWGFI